MAVIFHVLVKLTIPMFTFHLTIHHNHGIINKENSKTTGCRDLGFSDSALGNSIFLDINFYVEDCDRLAWTGFI